MICCAFAAPSWSTEAMNTVPSSSMSIFAPVSSMMLRITLPPEPITSRILSGSIFIVMMRGAYWDICLRGSAMVSNIIPMMCMRPL